MQRAVSCFALLLCVSTSAPGQQAWTVDAKPALEIAATAADGSLRFTTASWAAPLADGGVAITDGPEGQVKLVARDGRIRTTIGRRGGGPGEFQGLVWAGSCGAGSIYAWDALAGRVSVFTTEGRYLRQFSLPDARESRQATCSADGRFAALSMPEQGGQREADERGKTSGGGEYEVRRMRASVIATDQEGAVTARIPGVRWGEMMLGTLGPGGGRGALPRPLGGRTLVALAATGIVVAESDSARVSWYGVDGARQGVAGLPRSTRAPTAAEYERAIAPAMVGAPAALLETIDAFARSVPPPTVLPPVTGLAVDPQGIAWVVTTPDGAPRTRLLGLRSDGSSVASLEIPAALTLFAVTQDLVLGRGENADGEHVVLGYRFRRR